MSLRIDRAVFALTALLTHARAGTVEQLKEAHATPTKTPASFSKGRGAVAPLPEPTARATKWSWKEFGVGVVVGLVVGYVVSLSATPK